MARSAAEIVKDVLIEKLGLDDEEVQPGALISQELGMDSIDDLDIDFTLGRRIGVGIDNFRVRLYEGMNGGLPGEFDTPVPKYTEDIFKLLDVVERILDVPYTTAPGTVARLVEIVEREMVVKLR